MNINKIKDLYIAKNKIDFLVDIDEKLDYFKWATYIDAHKDYFIWDEDTSIGKVWQI